MSKADSNSRQGSYKSNTINTQVIYISKIRDPSFGANLTLP